MCPPNSDLPECVYLAVEVGEGIAKGAALVDKATSDSLGTVDKASRIRCYLIRSGKHCAEIVFADG